LIRYDDALARIWEAIAPLPPVELPPLRLLGCYLAAPLVAPIPLPPCDDSAMDGYAVVAAATTGASRESPRWLAVGSEARPIATGDPMPADADAVVPIEWVRVERDRIAVLREVVRGANVRRRGEDVEAGDVVAPAGMRIDPGLVLAAGSLGVERLSAHPRVRIAVLPVGHHLAAGRPDATGPAVAAAVRAWGAAARLLPPATGGAEAVAERIRRALRTCDLLITAGAASVGADDVVPAAVESIGAQVLFHGVSIKPGKPIGVAQWEGRTLLLLPGSPTAALAGLEGIGRAVHARLAGADRPTPVAARLGRRLQRRRGKTGLLRGTARVAGSTLIFEPAAKQGPAQISAVVGTNALAVIPPDAEGIEAGAPLQVLLLDRPAAAANDGRLYAVCGWSGAGKTWVVEQLVARLTAAGLRVATIKHHGCGDSLEPAEKDTARHRSAGAMATALVAAEGTTVVRAQPVSLETLAAELLAGGADLVIAEGFKSAAGVPKIEVAARGRERVHAAPLFALVAEEGGIPPTDEGMDRLAAMLLER